MTGLARIKNLFSKRRLIYKDAIFVSAGDHDVFAVHALKYYSSFFYIVVVYYGEDTTRACTLYDDADELYFRKGSKYQNLKFVYESSSSKLSSFETVTVWDDDARIQRGSLYDIVSVLDSNPDLLIAGAAQHPAGLVPHRFMRPVYENAVRVTNFTEMNFVTFKRSALSKFMTAYDGSVSGWGMDFFFCQVLNPSLKEPCICIVDSVVVLNRQKRFVGKRSDDNVRYRVYKSEMDSLVPRSVREKQWSDFAKKNNLRVSYEQVCFSAYHPGNISSLDSSEVVSPLPVDIRSCKDVRGFHNKSSLRVSVLCACKDRLGPLLKSLPTWLDCPYVEEIVLVDWSSKEPLIENCDIQKYIAQGYVRIVRVEDETYFSLAKAYNLAKDYAAFPVVMKMDTDYAIKSSTWMDRLVLKKFGRRGKYRSLRNYFIHGWWYFAESLGGFCLLNKSDWVDYNEHFVGWGYDDTDFYTRVRLSGVTSVPFSSIADYLFHIPHDKAERVASYPIADKRESELRNKALSRNKLLPMRLPYNILEKTFEYTRVEYAQKHGLHR
jgi:hypothetical protein